MAREAETCRALNAVYFVCLNSFRLFFCRTYNVCLVIKFQNGKYVNQYDYGSAA